VQQGSLKLHIFLKNDTAETICVLPGIDISDESDGAHDDGAEESENNFNGFGPAAARNGDGNGDMYDEFFNPNMPDFGGNGNVNADANHINATHINATHADANANANAAANGVDANRVDANRVDANRVNENSQKIPSEKFTLHGKENIDLLISALSGLADKSGQQRKIRIARKVKGGCVTNPNSNEAHESAALHADQLNAAQLNAAQLNAAFVEEELVFEEGDILDAGFTAGLPAGLFSEFGPEEPENDDHVNELANDSTLSDGNATDGNATASSLATTGFEYSY
jgi:hypothetical protein